MHYKYSRTFKAVYNNSSCCVQNFRLQVDTRNPPASVYFTTFLIYNTYRPCIIKKVKDTKAECAGTQQTDNLDLAENIALKQKMTRLPKMTCFVSV